MATWVDGTSTSAGGNITLKVSGGYANVSRNQGSVGFNWGVRFKSDGSWTYNSIAAFPGGTRYYAFNSGSGGSHIATGTWYYATSTSTSAAKYTTESAAFWGSGTATGSGSGNIQVSVGTGWNAWTPSSNYTYKFNVPYSAIGGPTVSAWISGVGVDRATIWAKITNNPSNHWRLHLYNTSGSWVTYHATGAEVGYTQTGLSHNTSYNMYWQTTNQSDGEGSGLKAVGFTTSGNAPVCTGVWASNITRTSASIQIDGTYDHNASWGGGEYAWGTTTNYGSSGSSMTGLSANTTYYIKARFKDNWGRWSNYGTNSFVTLGNAPTINSITPVPYRTWCDLSNNSVSYDTNDSFKSLSLQYGTSTSYGSTSTSSQINNLQPNTTYYYKMTVTSSKDRTSSAKTGSFKTTAYMPSNVTTTVSDVLPFTANVRVTGSGDTNAGVTNYKYYYRTKPTKPTYDMPIMVFSDGSTWARIFYHNNKNGSVLFSSVSEARNTQQADKYSRLYLLDDNTYKGADGKFEFMLRFPVDTPSQYNRWKQTNSPCNEFTTRTSGGTRVTGYEAVNISWTSNYWGGLERFHASTTELGSCYLTGSVGHNNWYYALGTSTKYSKGSPMAVDVNDSTADVVELWVRLDDGTVTTTNMGTSTTAAVSGLAEETDYIFFSSATNAIGTTWSPAVHVTTLADQAKIRIKGNALPDTYQRVEYIQTDGAQLINLGKVGDTVATYDIAFISDNHRQLMGYGGSGSEYWGATNSTKYESGGTQGEATDTTKRRTITWTYSYRDDISKVEYDGVSIANPNGASKNVDENGYKLFNIADNASADYGCACKLYGLQMWHYGNLVRNLIPCYRKSDNVIGLFDTVGMTFYTNIGTGNFTKGGNVATGTGWLKGKTYYKNNGAWVKAKKIYIKVDGQWKIGTNYDD